MGKIYAYCPSNFVEFIERRTKDSTDLYPLKKYYHGSVIPFFKEIPEDQQTEVEPLWMYDEKTYRFIKPEPGQVVGNSVYLGTVTVKSYNEVLNELSTLQEENAMLADVLQEVLLK